MEALILMFLSFTAMVLQPNKCLKFVTFRRCTVEYCTIEWCKYLSEVLENFCHHYFAKDK